MGVVPETRSSFTSTVWNSAARGARSTRVGAYGGPNVNLSEGSKVQFAEGSGAVWSVDRIFADGELLLSTVSSGTRRTRRVHPDSPSWTNLLMVDSKRIKNFGQAGSRQQLPSGGGPLKTLDPGNVVTLGTSQIRWVVESVLRDGTVTLQTFNGERIIRTKVGPQSPYWNSMYSSV